MDMCSEDTNLAGVINSLRHNRVILGNKDPWSRRGLRGTCCYAYVYEYSDVQAH